MNIVNQMLLTTVLFFIVVFLGAAMVNPTGFGKWLQQIDNSRYEFTLGE